MVMDAAGEPYSLQINLESLELLAFADISLLRLSAFADTLFRCLAAFADIRCRRLCLLASSIVAIDCLQGLADAQVVLSLLVERDVTSHQRSHCQAIDIQFLVERQFVKTLQFVTKHLDVGEALLGVYITFCHV